MTDENTRASQLGKLLDTRGPDSGDIAYLRSVADELGADGTDEGAAHSHNLQAIADKIDRASLQPSVVEAGTVSDVFIDRTDTALAPTTQGTDSGLAVFDEDDLIDEVAEAISDSFDVDWDARDGARHVVGLLEHKGLVALAEGAGK